MPSYEYKAHSGKSIAQLRPPLGEGYYVTIVGTEKLNITDDEGNTNTDIGDIGFELAVPGVTYGGGLYSDEINVGYHDLSMPADEGEYTIKFRTGSDSVDIVVLKGVGNTSPDLAIRYIDLDLPPNVECLLTFSPAGVPDLSYDSNGDGTYDTVVPAHVRVSGTAAQDVTAPEVSIEFTQVTATRKLLTINATDSQSGVGTIYYQLPGHTNFQVYTEPVSMPPLTLGFVRAFADDNVGNRSSPVKKKVSEL